MRTVCALLLAVFSLNAFSAEARDDLESFLNGLKSLTADFSQRLLDENNKLLETSSGKLYVRRPGNFRWDYQHPYPQEIVGSKGYVWVYDSDLEQVSVKPMDAALGNSPALLLTSEEPLGSLFKVRSIGESDGINWVELKPLGEDAAFSSFRVGMTSAGLQVMELLDNFGQRTQLSLDNVVRNPKLDDGLFTFKPPPGTDVVGEQPKQ
ncbi:MAG: outer membrane lipoprotein chaperone LolA [Pseudomonadota bacterium]